MIGEQIYEDYKAIGNDYARTIEIAISHVGKEKVFNLLEECERDEKVLHFIDPSIDYVLEKLTQQENKEFRLVAKSAEAAIYITPLSWQPKIHYTNPNSIGKSLDWPPPTIDIASKIEEEERKKKEAIISAIYLLMALDKLFVNSRETVTKNETKEVNRTYYAESEYFQMFENRFREKKCQNTVINRKGFVELEKEIFKDLLKQIKNTGADKKYIKDHEAYNRGTQYLNFLEKEKNRATIEPNSEEKPEPPQTQNSIPPNRPKTKRIPFENLLLQDKFPGIESKLNAYKGYLDSGKSVIVIILALDQCSAIRIPTNQSAFWESVNKFFNTAYKVQYYSPEYKKAKESINNKSQDPDLYNRFKKICNDLGLTDPG